jgi:hypothetical protein
VGRSIACLNRPSAVPFDVIDVIGLQEPDLDGVAFARAQARERRERYAGLQSTV